MGDASPARPLMRKGCAVGFVVPPRVDADLAQVDESALPPLPGKKARTPRRSKAEPRACGGSAAFTHGGARAAFGRGAGGRGRGRFDLARAGATRSFFPRPVADGRLVWSSAAWKATPESRTGGACSDLVVACRNARPPAPFFVDDLGGKPPVSRPLVS